jgi:hypothetical protein
MLIVGYRRRRRNMRDFPVKTTPTARITDIASHRVAQPLCILLWAVAASAQAQSISFNFDDLPAGSGLPGAYIQGASLLGHRPDLHGPQYDRHASGRQHFCERLRVGRRRMLPFASDASGSLRNSAVWERPHGGGAPMQSTGNTVRRRTTRTNNLDHRAHGACGSGAVSPGASRA